MFSPLILATTLRLLTLDQALETARAHHPQLRVADAQVQSARVRADSQRSGLYPSLDASARYGVSAGNSRGTTTDPAAGGFFTFDGSQSYSAGLSAGMLLWDFGRTRDRWRAAVAGVESQSRARDTTVSDLMLTVEVDFFDALAKKELVDVERENRDNEQRHLEQVSAFVDVGSRPEIDLAKVRTTLANAEAALIRAQNSYELAKAQLNQSMGVSASTDYDVVALTPSPVAGEDGATADLVATAIQNRSEFAELAADIRAQQLTLHQARRGLWPSLRVSADASYSGSHFSDPGWGAGVGVSLSWPIFDGWATRDEIRSEELGLVVLDAQKEALRQEVWLEIDTARLNVRSAKAAKVAADQALASARELLGLAEGRYEAGVGDIIELGDAQIAVTQAASQAVQTTYDLAIARARLTRAVGR